MERPVLVWYAFMMKYFSVPLGMGVVAFLFIACCYLKTLWTILRRDVTSIVMKLDTSHSVEGEAVMVE